MHLIAGSFTNIVQSQIPIWDKVLRTVAVYALIYILMRLAKRDAAQLTASDFVVVLLLSNVVQNAIIGPDNSLVGGAWSSDADRGQRDRGAPGNGLGRWRGPPSSTGGAGPQTLARADGDGEQPVGHANRPRAADRRR